MALWKDIPGYEGLYQISDEGEVKSLPRKHSRRENILKPGTRAEKYKFVTLIKEGTEKKFSVHRLVATAFLETDDYRMHINHIDKDPSNNRVENLEWCTQKYNNEYSHNKKIAQYTKQGEKIAVYKSIVYASEQTGIKRTSIGNCINGLSRSAGGYVWKEERE